MKVQACNSLEPTLVYNQDQMKMGKEIPESSRLEFLKKFLANNFALSKAEGNTFGPLNRGVIASLPLLRTLLAICQKKVSGK